MRLNISAGDRFGEWTVAGFVGIRGRRTYWLAICSCGTKKEFSGSDLVSKRTTKCRECTFRTHGMSHTQTYRAWAHMVQRCTNKNSKDWPDYGGRGIALEPEWTKFENFLADMGERPDGMSIDRKDNNAGYTKSNCRWATKRQQASNKRTTRIVIYMGEQMSLAEAAEKIGIGYHVLHKRITRNRLLGIEGLQIAGPITSHFAGGDEPADDSREEKCDAMFAELGKKARES